jgi:hypothetical protein
MASHIGHVESSSTTEKINVDLVGDRHFQQAVCLIHTAYLSYWYLFDISSTGSVDNWFQHAKSIN